MLARSRHYWKPAVCVIVTACCILFLTSYRTAIFSYKQYLNYDFFIRVMSERHNISYTTTTTSTTTTTTTTTTNSCCGWCPEGLKGMLQGHWEPGIMTADDVQRMENFLKGARKLPTGLQREDNQCGNVTLKTITYRGLCDPDGPTPCCDNSNTCVAKTVAECRCVGCWDMRTELHAEYATWRTAQPGCQPQDHTPGELCELLEGGTFFFMGDSLMRGVYLAMVLTARGNDETMAFLKGMPAEFQEECKNLFMFSGFHCRIKTDTVVPVCNGTVVLRFTPRLHSHEGADIQAEIMTLKNKTRSVVVIGIGLHDRLLKPKETFEQVLRPVLEQMRQEAWRWPLIIWTSVHSFGPLLFATAYGPQNNAEILLYNRQMEELLAPYTTDSLPLYVFNAFNLTSPPVASFDGIHFGLGVNKVKIKILMNFLWRLRRDGVW